MYDKFYPYLRFWILVEIILIAGFSQGMLLPVTAILFEQAGISSSINGLHTTGVYIGILIATPFLEGLLRKFGYRHLLLQGSLLIVLPLAFFPLWKSFIFWFILRLFIGIGISILQYGAQTWITYISPPYQRGRNLALFGLSFGLGFGLGPLMTRFLQINESLPFFLTAGIGLIVCFTVLLLKNEQAEQEEQEGAYTSMTARLGKAWQYAWAALLLPFTYGFLEAVLNGNFPVYALNIGIDVNSVSMILPAFAIGSIVFQLPLGLISDRFDRRKVLLAVMLAGFVCFTIAGIIQESVIGLSICFFAAGMFVGSTYSLGVSFMVDLMSKNLLAVGNMLCGLFLSIGSISGPFIEGLTLQYIEGINFFYTISFVLLSVCIALLFFKKKQSESSRKEVRSIS